MPILPYREPEVFDSIEGLEPLLGKLNVRSVLLVTDPFLRSSGSTARLESLLQKNNIHCAVYDKTCANPTVYNVEEARALYVDEKCECLIAFGGGSSMDCAKAVGAHRVPEKIACQTQRAPARMAQDPDFDRYPHHGGYGQ